MQVVRAWKTIVNSGNDDIFALFCLYLQTVYEMTSSSSITVGLSELRQAYTKRLAVVTAARTKWLSGGGRASDNDVSGLGLGPGDLAIDANCFAGMLPHPQQSSPQRSGDFTSEVDPRIELQG